MRISAKGRVPAPRRACRQAFSHASIHLPKESPALAVAAGVVGIICGLAIIAAAAILPFI